MSSKSTGTPSLTSTMEDSQMTHHSVAAWLFTVNGGLSDTALCEHSRMKIYLLMTKKLSIST